MHLLANCKQTNDEIILIRLAMSWRSIRSACALSAAARDCFWRTIDRFCGLFSSSSFVGHESWLPQKFGWFKKREQHRRKIDLAETSRVPTNKSKRSFHCRSNGGEQMPHSVTSLGCFLDRTEAKTRKTKVHLAARRHNFGFRFSLSDPICIGPILLEQTRGLEAREEQETWREQDVEK